MTPRVHPLDAACCAAFVLYAATVVATPICLIEMGNDLGFSFAGGGGLELARAMLLLFTLFVSGQAAARWGKVRCLSAGALIASGGAFLFSTATSYWHGVAGIGLMGFGCGILEALINPLIQDLHPQDSGRYVNIVNAFFSLGVLVAAIGVGEAITRGVSWRAVFAALGVVAALIALVFRRGRRSSLPPSSGHRDAMLRILRSKRFWWFGLAMFCAGGAEAAFTFWSATYVRIGFGTAARAGALSTACFAGAMVVGRVATGKWERRIGLQRVILASAALGLAAAMAVPFVRGLALYFGVLALAGLAVACFWPSIQVYAAQELPVDATLLFIFLSCLGIPGFGLTGWLMGIVADAMSLRAAFLVVPVLFVLLAIGIVMQHLTSASEGVLGSQAARARE